MGGCSERVCHTSVQHDRAQFFCVDGETGRATAVVVVDVAITCVVVVAAVGGSGGGGLFVDCINSGGGGLFVDCINDRTPDDSLHISNDLSVPCTRLGSALTGGGGGDRGC